MPARPKLSDAQGKPDLPAGAGFSAYFLVGPTAVGKTAVAQLAAERQGWEILSADSMLVYRGMDVATDKPGSEQRRRVPYHGLDLVAPDAAFSVGEYLRHARQVFENARARGKTLLVAGGTGLYVKCLTEGLAELPAADAGVRARAERILREGGLEALQAALRDADRGRYEALGEGASNPRRLIRAMELAAQSSPVRTTWSGTPSAPLVGLRMEPALLRDRIERRVRRMYEGGLLEEVERLLTLHPGFSSTARQAIGYKEALAVRAGDSTLDEAIARTVARTRQLAKRQMTWFRHQARVEWVTVVNDSTTEELAGEVLRLWSRYGPPPVNA